MSAFNVKVAKVVHSGGSKFYQIVAIQGKGNSVCLTHWGKYSGDIPRPLHGGETQLETYPIGSGGATQMRQKMRDKTKRGYKDWDESDTPMTADALKKFITDSFPTDKRKAAFDHLIADLSSADIDGPPEVDPAPAPAPKREPSAPTTKTSSKEWGSW